MGFLTLPELARASRVSRAWQNYIAPNHVWKKACLTNQFPLVIGGARNIQKDVGFLYPRTVSGQSLSETIGRPVEKKDGKLVAAKAGNISERVFNMRLQQDPFAPAKPIDLVFLCEFRFVERMLESESLPYGLDEFGNLISIDGCPEPEPKLAMIPLSSKNLYVLTQHPLKGQENRPVFTGLFSQNVFNQTNTCAPKDQTRYMWREMVLRNTSALDQKALVKAKGNEIGAPELAVISFLSRAIYDAVKILESGTCPDDRGLELWRYPRFPDEKVVIGGTNCPVALGRFTPGSGADVGRSNFVDEDLGVVPGGPAEVPGH
jgi:hypothetical protein